MIKPVLTEERLTPEHEQRHAPMAHGALVNFVVRDLGVEHGVVLRGLPPDSHRVEPCRFEGAGEMIAFMPIVDFA